MEKNKEKTGRKQRVNNGWKPGQSGNPKGRPKGKGIAAHLREMAEDVHKSSHDDWIVTRGEALAKALFDMAETGDPRERLYAIEKILEYVDGKAPTKILRQSLTEDRRDAIRYRIRRGLCYAQLQLIDSIKRRKLGMAGRRAGKTYCIARRFVDLAAMHDGGEALYIGLTAKTAWEQMLPHVIDAFSAAKIDHNINAAKSLIEYEGGGLLRFCGNESRDDREKMRGYGKDRRLVVIDECQSQKELRYLITEILEPTLFDTQGTIEMYGTPPRVRGTFWEHEWSNTNLDALKISWTMFDNPAIPDPQRQLDDLMLQRGWTLSSTIVQREYLGKIIYDDEALVIRLTDKHYYTDEDYNIWREKHGDVRIVCGLDLGYEDADAVCALAYSPASPMVWVVYEQTVRRQTIGDLVSMVREALDKSAVYGDIRGTFVLTDMGGLGKKIAEDLFYAHNLPIMPAEKSAKEAAVEMLQHAVITGNLRVRKDGLFDADAKRIVYKRDELDNIIRVVDDDICHSDIFDAVLYAYREAVKHVGA
jgi:hypothetical protein